MKEVDDDVGCFQLGWVSLPTMEVDTDDYIGTSGLAWQRTLAFDVIVVSYGRLAVDVVCNCLRELYTACYSACS